MSSKQKLRDRFLRKDPTLTIANMDTFMKQCGCVKATSGRGSGIRYVHMSTKRIITFDGPHPQKELKRFHLKKIVEFLKEVGEV